MNFGIIAAGEGSRLKAENIEQYKPLVKVNGIPLIERLFVLAEKNDAESISCIVNKESLEVQDYIKNRNFSIPINLIIKSTLSSMHSFYELKPFLENSPFCLTTVDSVFDEKEFQNFIAYAINKNDIDGLLAVTDFIDDEKPLCLEVDENMRIEKFFDEAGNHKYATGGIYYFKKDIFNEMENTINSNVFRLRNFLKQLVAKNYFLEAYPFTKIIDVDHADDIKIAEEYLTNILN